MLGKEGFKFDHDLKIMRHLKRKDQQLRQSNENEERKVGVDEMMDSESVDDYKKTINAIFEGLYLFLCENIKKP